MKQFWEKYFAAVPMPLGGALLMAFAFWGFVSWDQSHWWNVKEDYGFGWLVPAFVAFVIHDRWARIAAATADCAAEGSPRASGFLGFLAYGALATGSLLFLLGAFYRAGSGPSSPGTLAITVGSIAILLPLIFFHTPAADKTQPAAHWREDARVRLVCLFIFPAFVWLVSAPMVSMIEENLKLFLLRKVTSGVFFVFDMLGLQIEQQGNVLVLPPMADGKPNQVGVEEACSGIRSLTACLFAGSFLAAVYLNKFWKKVTLVAASMCFAVVTNLMRGIFLTAWAYNYGHEAIEGFVHDAAGYAVLGLTVAGLLCMLPLFNLKIVFAGADEPAAESADENSKAG